MGSQTSVIHERTPLICRTPSPPPPVVLFENKKLCEIYRVMRLIENAHTISWQDSTTIDNMLFPKNC